MNYTAPILERQRRRTLALLDFCPEATFSYWIDSEADPDAVLFTLATRVSPMIEIRIPKTSYDPIALFMLIERHRSGATVHW